MGPGPRGYPRLLGTRAAASHGRARTRGPGSPQKETELREARREVQASCPQSTSAFAPRASPKRGALRRLSPSSDRLLAPRTSCPPVRRTAAPNVRVALQASRPSSRRIDGAFDRLEGRIYRTPESCTDRCGSAQNEAGLFHVNPSHGCAIVYVRNAYSNELYEGYRLIHIW